MTVQQLGHNNLLTQQQYATVVHNKLQYITDSYAPHNHHSSEAVYWRKAKH